MATPPTPSDIKWADIGVNLGDKQFNDDRDAVVDRAKAEGVEWMLLTGTSLTGSKTAIDLCDHYSSVYGNCYATVGIHPHSASDVSASVLSELSQLVKHPSVRAVGETGLDFNRDFSPRDQQERAFEQQLALAIDCQLPVFLHQRDAHPRFLPILKSFRDQLQGVVVHCFTDNKTALYDYLDLDCHIGITGWVCDERRGLPLAELVPHIPATRILIETDAPYLLPRNLPEPLAKKRRNEPAALPWIGQTIATLRNEPLTQVARQTYDNAQQLFCPAQIDT